MAHIYNNIEKLFLKINKIENCAQIVLLNNMNDKLLDSMRGDKNEHNINKQNEDQN